MKVNRKNCGNYRAAQAAFSIVEVVVGAFLFSVVSASLFTGISAGFSVIQIARENLRATQILQEKTETIRLFTWDQINSAANPYSFTAKFYPLANSQNQGIAYAGTRLISSAPISGSYSNDLKLVTFQLTWTSGRVQRQREMKTLVSQYGLHNYVFSGNP